MLFMSLCIMLHAILDDIKMPTHRGRTTSGFLYTCPPLTHTHRHMCIYIYTIHTIRILYIYYICIYYKYIYIYIYTLQLLTNVRTPTTTTPPTTTTITTTCYHRDRVLFSVVNSTTATFMIICIVCLRPLPSITSVPAQQSRQVM